MRFTVSSSNQQGLSGDVVRCGDCQRSVQARGIGKIACLVHLDMRDPAIERNCNEFEAKVQVRAAQTDDRQAPE